MKMMSTAFVKQLNIIIQAEKIRIRMPNKLFNVQVKRTLCCDQRKGMWKQVWRSQERPQQRDNSADDHETK